MLVIGYISEYWGLLVILIGTALVLHSDVHLERRMVRRIFASNMSVHLSFVSFARTWPREMSRSSSRVMVTAMSLSTVAPAFVPLVTSSPAVPATSTALTVAFVPPG